MRALIVFASNEGQTEQIATRLSHGLSEHNVPTDVYNVVEKPADKIA